MISPLVLFSCMDPSNIMLGGFCSFITGRTNALIPTNKQLQRFPVIFLFAKDEVKDVINLLRCPRCDFIAHVCVQGWTRLCPICGGAFLVLDESMEDDAEVIRLFKAIQAILGGGGFFA